MQVVFVAETDQEIPAPTLEVAVPFVFGALAVGAVGAAPLLERLDRNTLARGFLTGLAAVTLGVFGYTATYLLL